MKKFFLVMLAAIASLSISAEPYAMVVGSNKIMLEENGTSEFCNGDCHEYKALNVALNQGDLITFYDEGQGAGWAITDIEQYGAFQNFSSASDGITCMVAGTYDFYFKLEFGKDRVYIGESAGQGGNPGGGQGGGQTGKLYYYLKESGMGSPSADELFENGVLANYDLKATDASGKAYIFLIISNTEGSAIGQQYMTKAYVDGGTSAQFFPDGVSQYEKWGLQPGTYTFYLYKDEGDSYTMSTELIPGRTLVDADQTALDEVAVKAPAQKIIRNGEILIQVGDKFFNALGTEVK